MSTDNPEAKLEGFFQAFEQAAQERSDKAAAAREKRDKFIAGFDQLRNSVILEAFDRIGKALQAAGHQYTVEPRDFPKADEFARRGITFKYYAKGDEADRISSGKVASEAALMRISGLPDQGIVWVEFRVSRSSNGNSEQKIPLERLSVSWIENALTELLKASVAR